METEVCGIAVRVTRKRIRNMYMYVRPPDGRVEISAPYSVSNEDVARFVRSREEWIRKKQAAFQAAPRQGEYLYITGETLQVWGRPCTLQVVEGTRNIGPVLAGDRLIMQTDGKSTAERREARVREWYREQLKQEVERRLPGWIQLTGLKPASWQTRFMKTRWGTCNPGAGRIWLNPLLAQKPVECLDYVILHELTHLRVPNHGRAFIAGMDRYMPGWREIRKRLNNR